MSIPRPEPVRYPVERVSLQACADPASSSSASLWYLRDEWKTRAYGPYLGQRGFSYTTSTRHGTHFSGSAGLSRRLRLVTRGILEAGLARLALARAELETALGPGIGVRILSYDPARGAFTFCWAPRGRGETRVVWSEPGGLLEGSLPPGASTDALMTARRDLALVLPAVGDLV